MHIHPIVAKRRRHHAPQDVDSFGRLKKRTRPNPPLPAPPKQPPSLAPVPTNGAASGLPIPDSVLVHPAPRYTPQDAALAKVEVLSRLGLDPLDKTDANTANLWAKLDTYSDAVMQVNAAAADAADEKASIGGDGGGGKARKYSHDDARKHNQRSSDELLFRNNRVFLEIKQDTSRLNEVFMENEKDEDEQRSGMGYYECIYQGPNLPGQRTVKGDLYFRQYMANFSHFRVLKFGPQMDVIRSSAAALMAQMFGDTFEDNKDRIKRMYGIADFKKEILVTMPRRCGKSMVGAMIEANCLYTIGGSSAVFAPFFFQSNEFKRMVYDFVCSLPNGREMCVINNKNKLKVSHSRDPKEKCRYIGEAGEMTIFSGKVTAARGFTACRIYYDEASFADPEFITSNVFAGMLLESTFVFLISSPPDDSNNVFNQMCHAKNTRGESIFKWIRVESMCQACQQAKLIRCTHVTVAIPPWQAGSEERENIELVLGAIDPRRYRIEILGLAEGTDIAAFPRENIEAFMRQDVVEFVDCPEFIAIAVDPSAEGDSKTGIVALARDDKGNFVIVGVEAIEINSIENDILAAVNFCNRLRTHPWAEKSTFVYIIESNHGGTPRSAEFIKALRKNTPCFAVSQDIEGKNRPGIWVTHDYKERFVQFTNKILKEGRLSFHHILESRHKDPHQLIFHQLRGFHRQYAKRSNFSTGKIPYKYSGKGGKGQNDDVCMALMECLFFFEKFLRDPYDMARFNNLPIGVARGVLTVNEEGMRGMKWDISKHRNALFGAPQPVVAALA